MCEYSMDVNKTLFKKMQICILSDYPSIIDAVYCKQTCSMEHILEQITVISYILFMYYSTVEMLKMKSR